jgi:predicted small metal-binding protein
MKAKIAAVASGLCVASASTLLAQDEPKPTTHKKVRTLSGCLQKGDGDKEGDNWEIKSDAVALSEHVGHTVKVTGVVSNAAIHGAKEDAKEKAAEHGIEHDVLRKAAEHAKTAHHMESIPPDVLSKVKGAIHDEGDARTQKAGSSN